MSITTRLNSLLIKGLFALTLAICLNATADAKHKDKDKGNDVVTITSGVVDVEEDGTVVVYVEREALFPSNGHGLFRSGQIATGDVVTVKIVQNKRGKHRGHVTVLK